MQVQIIAVTMFQSNCIVVWDDKTMAGVVFDPGGDSGKVFDFLDRKKIQVKGIYLTHGHVDHVAGVNRLKKLAGNPKVHMHEGDRTLAGSVGRQCLAFGIPMEESPEVDVWVKDGDPFKVEALEFSALHTPGHSPGSVAYLFSAPEPLLISGDLLFAGSIGRMDLPGGSEEQMKKSLARVAALSEDLVVIPGHGPKTTIGLEKAQNPYLAEGTFSWQ